MSDLNKILLFTFLIPALTINASPIANIEDVRRSNEVGSFRDLEFAFSGTRGNEERDDYDIINEKLRQPNSKMAKFNLGMIKNIG